MAANLDDKIGKIVNRAQLLEWVQALPENAKGVIVVDLDPMPEDPDSMTTMKYREIGGVTLADTAYYLQSYLHHIFSR